MHLPMLLHRPILIIPNTDHVLRMCQCRPQGQYLAHTPPRTRISPTKPACVPCFNATSSAYVLSRSASFVRWEIVVAVGSLTAVHGRLCIGVEEELEVSHSAFHKAFEDAKPEKAQVPGLQEFAASIWARRRQIPSSTRDPVTHIFDEVGLHVGRVGRISHLTHGTDCLSHPAV